MLKRVPPCSLILLMSRKVACSMPPKVDTLHQVEEDVHPGLLAAPAKTARTFLCQPMTGGL